MRSQNSHLHSCSLSCSFPHRVLLHGGCRGVTSHLRVQHKNLQSPGPAFICSLTFQHKNLQLHLLFNLLNLQPPACFSFFFLSFLHLWIPPASCTILTAGGAARALTLSSTASPRLTLSLQHLLWISTALRLTSQSTPSFTKIPPDCPKRPVLPQDFPGGRGDLG